MVGSVLGAMIAGYALPGIWPVLVVAVSMLAVVLTVTRDRERDGFLVNGYRPGRTRRVSYTLVAVTWFALAAAIVLKNLYAVAWAPIAIGAATVVFGTIGSIVWERVYRRELSEVSLDR